MVDKKDEILALSEAEAKATLIRIYDVAGIEIGFEYHWYLEKMTTAWAEHSCYWYTAAVRNRARAEAAAFVVSGALR